MYICKREGGGREGEGIIGDRGQDEDTDCLPHRSIDRSQCVGLPQELHAMLLLPHHDG